ncbi:SLAC1 anion channel family protein [Roseicyclus persicicus]|uniref:C4-dicarboxylate ABC transporter n=1 Tax=Roseicyclus persicicus TaxID=2650661 RepID=A0A7X6K0G1_9RHOB|nr:SLAC1 anion channel family protein [Roseibacterium persicicum]NKX46240.1 C4-dicarboxylate ABC transporter [Roseibacterium persicicum]
MAEAQARETDEFSRLEHLPVTFFAVLMGLFGLALALHAAAGSYDLAEGPARAVLWLGLACFVGIGAVYLAKAVRYPRAVAAEWHHPVKLAFFPTITISLLLMATAIHGYRPDLAGPVWLVGMVGQGVLTVAVISGWISHRAFEVGHLTPAWFIPAVGNVIVPLAGVPLGWVETSWLFFSAGMIFWLILLVLVFNRLIFHAPIPARLFPTLVILIAPPAVAFVSYTRLAGGIDPFAHVLLNAAYVFAALVLVQVPKLAKLPFALSWWALSFPLAALSVASFAYGRAAASAVHVGIGLVVLAALLAVVAGLLWRTGLAIARDEICRPE